MSSSRVESKRQSVNERVMNSLETEKEGRSSIVLQLSE